MEADPLHAGRRVDQHDPAGLSQRQAVAVGDGSVGQGARGGAPVVVVEATVVVGPAVVLVEVAAGRGPRTTGGRGASQAAAGPQAAATDQGRGEEVRGVRQPIGATVPLERLRGPDLDELAADLKQGGEGAHDVGVDPVVGPQADAVDAEPVVREEWVVTPHR